VQDFRVFVLAPSTLVGLVDLVVGLNAKAWHYPNNTHEILHKSV